MSRARTVCATAGCGALVDRGHCPPHRAHLEQRRGSRQQRGYNAAHTRLRAQWAPLVATGTVACWRCHKLIPTDTPWDLGHDDHDRTIYRGPEHPPCNRNTTHRTTPP